jgi:long-chain acyl-CoA synthetase
VFLSFLPLSHAYEHTGGQFGPDRARGQIYYAEGLEKLASNIEEARPTLMVVVPRLFEVLRTAISKAIEKQGGLSAKLLARALDIAGGIIPGTLRWTDRPMKLIVDRLFKPKIGKRFGGRLKAMVSGGAPLTPEVGIFFHSIGVTLLQGYGQTEAAPSSRAIGPKAGRAHGHGRPGAEGYRGPHRRGWRDPGAWRVGHARLLAQRAETARVLKDGWLHTGDIGVIDAAGRIKITDRKKDLIINDKGDNVAPQKVEGMLTLQPEIAQAMIAGDRRPHMVALIVPDPEWVQEWCARHGQPCRFDALAQNSAFRTALGHAVERVNKDLSVIERVRRFTLADEPFTIENGQMTPSLKIRRHEIKKMYGERLDALYGG